MSDTTKSNQAEEMKRLTGIFRKLKADDPESWARSQIEEGIPQLAIFCFCRALWDGVIDENDGGWIDREIKSAEMRPSDPCSQIGPALQEMLAKGVSREVIVDLVRVTQFQLLFHVSTLVDGAQVVDLPVNNWTLHQVDENGDSLAIIQGLHEVLLSMDPTGREMRPRGSA